mmetsp:Transcript_13629/g.27908  ORF Transcript_13629/g.27908 Transcript_13629/m.27908 type:complete len:88 (+) Transcript_13629:40-303(+)
MIKITATTGKSQTFLSRHVLRWDGAPRCLGTWFSGSLAHVERDGMGLLHAWKKPDKSHFEDTGDADWVVVRLAAQSVGNDDEAAQGW